MSYYDHMVLVCHVFVFAFDLIDVVDLPFCSGIQTAADYNVESSLKMKIHGLYDSTTAFTQLQ